MENLELYAIPEVTGDENIYNPYVELTTIFGNLIYRCNIRELSKECSVGEKNNEIVSILRELVHSKYPMSY